MEVQRSTNLYNRSNRDNHKTGTTEQNAIRVLYGKGLILTTWNNMMPSILFKSAPLLLHKHKIKMQLFNIETVAFLFSGERGIRTPGPLTVNGFQDRRNRPLCHLSAAKVRVPNLPTKKILLLFAAGLESLCTSCKLPVTIA